MNEAIETKTTRNSRHADPDHRVTADRVGAKRGGGLHGSTSGIAQVPRWKYVFPDICKKTQKSFIRLLAPLEDAVVAGRLQSASVCPSTSNW